MAEQEEQSPINNLASQAKGIVGDQIKQKVKQQVVKFLITTFPTWGPILLGIIAITVILLAIYNSIIGGSAGSTPERLSKNNPTVGPRAENTVKAQAGDKQALSVLLTDEADKTIAIATELKATTGSTVASNSSFIARALAANGADPQSIIRKGADNVIENMSTVGAGNIEHDKRMINESMALAQIFQAEKKDENGVIVSPEIPGGELGNTIEQNGTNRQKQLGRELLEQIALLEEFVAISNNPRLVINERDKQLISQGEVDIRILQALNYLVTPTKFGGAGHRKIKVERIKHGYDTEATANSREWGEQTSDDPETRKLISPHSTGQAMDISVIGYVDRQLYKKSIAKKKRKPLSPKDILVTNQSKEKGKGLPGDGGTGLDGQSFAEIFEKAGISGLLTVVGENTGYDLSGVKAGTGTIGDISKNIGLAVLSQEIGITIDPMQDNSSTEKLATNVGKGLIADCLNIPVSAIRGSTPEEIRVNIGRALIEERIGLHPRSLSGNSATGKFADTINSDEIIKSIGKRKIEHALGIRTMALDYIKPTDSLENFVGAVVIEQTLNLPAGSMLPANLAEIKTKIGEEKFAKVFGDPEGSEGLLASGTQADKIDGLLGNSFDNKEFGSSRMTYLFKSGRMSPTTYKTKVGTQFLKAKFDNFQNYQSVKEIVPNPRAGNPITAEQKELLEEALGNSSRYLTEAADAVFNNTPPSSYYVPGDTANHQDEIFDIPEGNISRIRGQAYDAAWKDIGLDELSKKLGNTDEERQVIRLWLENKTTKLEDLGYAVSLIDVDGTYQTLDDLRIRTRDRIKTKDENEISRLREEIKAEEAELASYKNSLEGLGGKSQAQIQLLLQNIARVVKSLKVKKQQLTIEIATIDQWNFISEGSLTNLLILPDHAFSQIFIENKGAEVFNNIGQIKSDTAGILQLTQERRVQEINRLQEQLDSFEAEKEIIYESESVDENGNPVNINQADIDQKIASITAKEQNTQIRIAEIANQGALIEKSKATKDLTFCNDPIIQGILTSSSAAAVDSIEKIALTMGLKKIENKTNLPAGALELAIDHLGLLGNNDSDIPKTTIQGSASDKQMISVGQKYIEKVFDPKGALGKNWFDGSSLDDIRSKNIIRLNLPSKDFGESLASGIESEKKLLGAFGYTNEKYDFGSEYATKLDLLKERYNTLPLHPRDYEIAKAMDDKIIASFGIAVDKLNNINGLSAKLWAQTISPQSFAKEIGALVLKHKTASEISGNLGITIDGYKLNGTDIIDTLNGNLLPLAIKIGGEKMDKGLVLPLGTTKAIIDNPSAQCQVKEKIGGEEIQESCLENILRANGKDKLANIAGIVGSIGVSDNAQSNIGQQAIENILYSPTAQYKKEIDQMIGSLTGGRTTTLPAGWFAGENMIGVQRNILEKLGITGTTVIETSKLDILKARFNIIGPLNPRDSQITSAIDSKIMTALGNTEQAKKNIPSLTAKLFAQIIGPNSYSEVIGLVHKNQNPNTKGTLRDIGRKIVEDALDPKNTLPDLWFSGPSLDEGEDSLVHNLASIQGFARSNFEEKLTARFKAENQFLMIMGFGIGYDFGATFEGADMDIAEQILIALFNMEPNRGGSGEYSDPIGIYALSNANFSDHQSLLNAANKTDKDLSLPRGTTEKLLKNTITVDEYKKIAAGGHMQDRVGNNMCKQISNASTGGTTVVNGVASKETVQHILNKHDLDCEDLVDGLRDSDTLQNKAILAFIPPAEMSLLLGFQDQLGINVPIKGEFTANYAQKQIEEILGLNPGSFNPDQKISSVVSSNGTRRFIKSFRINPPNDRMSDSDLQTFLSQAVFIENGRYKDQLYWNEPIFGPQNTSKARTIDARLKINNISGYQDPTKSLLTGKISVKEYIELVRSNQFNSLDLAAFANFQADNGNSKVGKVFASLQLISAAQNGQNLRNPNFQVAMLDAFKNIGNYDVDDKIGWNPGTAKNILINRDLAKSVLIGQGIREASEALLGTRLDKEGLTTADEEFYNDLNLLLQYSVPGMSAPFAANITKDSDSTNPGEPEKLESPNSAACAPPPVPTKPEPINKLLEEDIKNPEKIKARNEAIEQYNEKYNNYYQYTGPAYTKQKRSACFDMVTKKILGRTIANITEIKVEKDGVVTQRIPGIIVPEKDLGMLIKGDTRILSAIGIAFGINQVNAAQIKKDNGEVEYKLLPPGFQISYQEIADATFGSETSKQRINQEVKNRFVKEQAEQLEFFGTGFGTFCNQENNNARRACREEYINNRLEQGKTGENTDDADLLKTLENEQRKEIDNLIPNSRRNLKFKYLDAQLATSAIKNNLPPPPPNFSKIMFTGTDRERNNMLLSYALTYALDDIQFLKDLEQRTHLGGIAVDALRNIATSSDPDRFQNNKLDDAGRDAVFTFVNERMQDILNKNLNTQITLPRNTAQLIYYSAVGNQTKFEAAGGRTIAQDFLRGQIGMMVDKQLGLPQGSTQAVYDLGSKISSGAQIKNADIAAVALIVFSKQLAKADENLGLPPGSLSSVISAVIAPNPISIAFAVYTIVFGYSKIENQMTCFQDAPLINPKNPLMSNIDAINWRSFCKENNAAYEQWAQANTRRLIDDMLRIGERTRDRSLIPPVIGTFRQEDVDFFNGIGDDGVKNRQADLSTLVHGFLPFNRGIKGVHQSDYMKDYVHIQY